MLALMDIWIELAADPEFQIIVLQNAAHRHLLLLIVDALRDNFHYCCSSDSRGLSNEQRGLMTNVTVSVFHMYCCLDDADGVFVNALVEHHQDALMRQHLLEHLKFLQLHDFLKDVDVTAIDEADRYDFNNFCQRLKFVVRLFFFYHLCLPASVQPVAAINNSCKQTAAGC